VRGRMVQGSVSNRAICRQGEWRVLVPSFLAHRHPTWGSWPMIRLGNQPQLTSGNSEGTLVARDERTDLPFRLPLSLVLRLARAQFE
jgi:hypothetical protein